MRFNSAYKGLNKTVTNTQFSQCRRPEQTPQATLPLAHISVHLYTHSDLGLSEGWGHIEVFGYHHMTEVVSVLNAPHSQPVYVVHREGPRELYFDVLPLVSSEWFKAETVTWRSAGKFLSQQTDSNEGALAFTCRCYDLRSPE